jgi:dipeptidyl aminopeptidase/acylaminoacyl peptidase
MKNFLLVIGILTSFITFSQKKVIDHTVYNSWKKLEGQIISNDGNFVAYTIKPHRGDGYLYIYNNKTAKLDSFPRGYKQQFSGKSNFLVFQITAGFDTLRKCELNKIDKDKWPKDSLGIYLLESDSLIKIPNVKNYSIAEIGDWVNYSLEKNKTKEDEEKEKIEKEAEKAAKADTTKKVEKTHTWCFLKKTKPEVTAKPEKKKEEEYKSDGKVFTSFNPFTNKKYEYKDVTDYAVSKNNKYVAITTHKKEKKIVSCELGILNPESGDFSIEAKKKTEFKGLTFNNSESALALISTEDTNKVKQFELNFLELKTKKWSTLIDTTTQNIPAKKGISENRTPVFSLDDSQLFFGIADRVKKEKKDTLVENEKVKLDLWNYKDTRLQPQQLFELKDDKKSNDLYVYHIEDKRFVQLSNDSLDIHLPKKPQGDYFFAENIQPYQGTYNWTSPNLKDHYRVSLKDGKIDLIKKEVGFGGELSPSGKYYTYYKGEEANHYLVDITSKKETCLTCSRKDVKWERDMNGQPQLAEPQGIYGWLKGENEVVIKSEYDIWNYTLSTGDLTSITNEEGKATKTRLSLNLWENDSIYIDYKNVSIHGFDEKTKGYAFYEIIPNQTKYELTKIYSMDNDLVAINRSKNGSKMILRRCSVKEYPDAIFMDADFKNEKRISNTNPQQNEYNWSTVELVDWISYDGIPLQGLLYKPENYDEEKSYPLIVYYYELYSDEFHNHYAPKPTASVVHATEYASAGYFVFIPDIRYRPGHPAKSAYDCIMSGTDKVLKLYPSIDSKRMGLQGQSWGGYQTAQMITMTNRYAAAMAGAPVSNMTSAYGGIRWESGLNRQFQYERQQSRIGATLWEAPELYIENSPLFHLPKVKTPLLIMANDEDGAVPWYQGIELFTGMKRLGKPCWMLNYNGDKHNLMKNANRIDLSIRMRQFFDHYLQGAPAPKWLTDGIPATVKGEEMRYETK